MYAAAFSLDLYCENNDAEENHSWETDPNRHDYGEFPHQFVGHDRMDTFRAARKRGWIINTRKRTCICPKCRNKKK